MFDMSMGELVVIGVIALIVIGPERLPKVARTVGHLLGRAQRYVNDVKSDIRREIELDELRKFKSEMEEAAQTVHTSMRDTTESLREPAQALRQELDEAAKAASGALSLSTPVVDEDGMPAHPAEAETAAAAQVAGPAPVAEAGAALPASPAAPAASPVAAPAAAAATPTTAAAAAEAAAAEAVRHGVPAPTLDAPAKPAAPVQPPTGTAT